MLRTLSTLGLQKNLLQAGTSRRPVASRHAGCCSITPAWDFSPSLPVLVRARRCSKGIVLSFASPPPLLPDFLTQGVSQQMLRLARIPNSRCLAKESKQTEEKKNPQVQRNRRRSPQRRAGPRGPAGREGARHHGRMLLPEWEAEMGSLRQAGRGENTS